MLSPWSVCGCVQIFPSLNQSLSPFSKTLLEFIAFRKVFGLSLFITGKALTTCSSQMSLYVEYLFSRFCREVLGLCRSTPGLRALPWWRQPQVQAAMLGSETLLHGSVILGFLLSNSMEFKNPAQETCAVCNLSFWSISAVRQFFPTASLSENSWLQRAAREGCGKLLSSHRSLQRRCAVHLRQPLHKHFMLTVWGLSSLMQSSAYNNLMGYSSDFQAV